MVEFWFLHWSVPIHKSIILIVFIMPLLFKKFTRCDHKRCVIGHFQNMCSMVSIELDQKSHNFEFLNKYLLVGSMRCSILYWKLVKTVSDVALKGYVYAWFQYIPFEYISMIVSHLTSCFVLFFVLLFCKLLKYLMTLFIFRVICNIWILLSFIALSNTHRFSMLIGMLLIKHEYTRHSVAGML